ncbi:PAS domain S-box protein [Parasediminibacterium sp. JCM 36343]|uniref:PAS domain S-box protein n=1 Tax=Parasediminibacterium sp. JCM 36343 TaxID=3374279 RepID=UPI00397D9670
MLLNENSLLGLPNKPDSHLAMYQLILQQAGFAFIMETKDGYIVETNEAAQEMFGYANEEFCTKKREEIIALYETTNHIYLQESNAFDKTKTKAKGIKKSGQQFEIEFSTLILPQASPEAPKLVCLFITAISKESISHSSIMMDTANDQMQASENKLRRTVEILEETNHIARVGGYEYDVLTNETSWTSVTKEIHEWPADFEPPIKDALLLFKEGTVRNTILKAVEAAIANGISFDMELPLTTAKGNLKWIRITGNSEFKNGICTRLYGIVQDIHEQKTAQESLANERGLLRTLIDNLPVAVFVKDKFGKKLIANKLDVQYMGLSTEEDAIGKTDLELFAQTTNHRGYKQDMQVLYTSQPIIEEEEVFSKADGGKMDVVISKFPLINQDGKIDGIIGICRDVTKQKAIEHRLQLVDFSFRNAAVSVFLIKEDASFYDFNEAAHTLLGYTKAEMMALTVEDIDPGYAQQDWPSHWATLREKGSMSFYSKEKTKEGKLIDVEIKANIIKYGDLELNCAFVTNITDKKKAEEALQKSYERYEYATIATSDAIWETDLVENKLFLSSNFELLFGHQGGLYDNADDNEWSRNVHPEDMPAILQAVTEILANNGNRWQNEYRFRKASGEYALVLDRGFVVRDSAGNATKLVGAMHDITESKKTELEKQHLVEELTRNNQELKQFTYITTHNLRGPLTNLVSICNMLDTEQIQDPRTLKLIDAFTKSTFYLNETLDDLIKVLLIRENRNLPVSTINFRDILITVASSIESIVQNAGAIISSDFTSVQQVTFNHAYMESIFQHLIINAIKYAHPDRKPMIEIYTVKEPGMPTQLIFSDNGIGMDMGIVKNRLFGLYQRFHNNADSKGVGLYLIHSQITALGGKIEAASEVNKGTTFTITFK